MCVLFEKKKGLKLSPHGFAQRSILIGIVISSDAFVGRGVGIARLSVGEWIVVLMKVIRRERAS